jgi:tetratricopeptide (TPR) repeat protein
MASAFPRPYIPVSQLLTAVLQLAAEHHRAGRQAAAATMYREVLELDPRNADALYLLGVLERQMGRLEEARRTLLEAARWTANRVPVEAELRIVERMLGKPLPMRPSRRPVQGWLERAPGRGNDRGIVAIARA